MPARQRVCRTLTGNERGRLDQPATTTERRLSPDDYTAKATRDGTGHILAVGPAMVEEGDSHSHPGLGTEPRIRLLGKLYHEADI